MSINKPKYNFIEVSIYGPSRSTVTFSWPSAYYIHLELNSLPQEWLLRTQILQKKILHIFLRQVVLN